MRHNVYSLKIYCKYITFLINSVSLTNPANPALRDHVSVHVRNGLQSRVPIVAPVYARNITVLE